MGSVMRGVAWSSPKAKQWVEGRRGIFGRMAEAIDPNAPIAWFHAASLGEFEQGRPVIERFRELHPEFKILLTFFSPSGYEVRKNYAGADYIFYLPTDTPRHVRRFMKIVRPRVAYFIKYEFWVNYLLALQRAGVPTYIFSTIFRPGQSFFRWHGGLMRRALRTFDRIFVQNEESKALLEGIGINRVTLAGDTRFDRVYAIARGAREVPEVAQFAEGAEVLIAGSTWPPDEQLLLELIERNPTLKLIIAPHEIDSARIEKFIARTTAQCLRFTQLDPKSDLRSARVLFIDTIGLLSSLYRYGRWGYIGGGFGTGIHNTLEAATFGLPLAFGPKYDKFQEAKDLIALGGACSIDGFEPLAAWLDRLRGDAMLFDAASGACRDYVEQHVGATELILSQSFATQELKKRKK